MENIEHIFNAKASSVSKLFVGNAGAAGFRIPSYQRPYDWKEDNITRLFEDVLTGFVGLKSDPESLTFLGTILLVSADNSVETDFDGTSLSVVDGQQRLTTLSLLIGVLLQELDTQKEYLIDQDSIIDQARNWLQKEIKTTRSSLFKCVVGQHSFDLYDADKSDYIFFPRIVREMDDIRASDGKFADYSSLISSYLFQLAISSQKNSIFSYEPPRDSVEGERNHFIQNTNLIRKLVDGYCSDELAKLKLNETPRISSVRDLLCTKNYKELFFKTFDDVREHELCSTSISKANLSEINRLVRTLSFSNYLIRRVVLTRVEVSEDKYAFDIFESLNTTGEPLTAIETFKPKVIEFEETRDDSRGYKNSESFPYFQELDSYLASFKQDGRNQAASNELVISFALYATGETVGKKLSMQRSYLRNQYSALGDVVAKRTRFVKGLNDVANYKKRFWDTQELSKQFLNQGDAQELLFCLNFIAQMNTSMSIPILTRYYVDYDENGNIESFVGAIRAVAAFLCLRRAATGGTQSIDADFRNLMKKGFDGHNPLMLGESMSNDLPSIEQLQSHFRKYLASNRIGVKDRNTWVQSMVAQPLYKSSVTLCKFLLMVSATYSAIDEGNPGLLKSARQTSQNCFMSLIDWRSEAFESVEHIAPDSRADGFGSDIYQSQITRNLIGNLTLLPKNENSRIGNKPWPKKKLYFSAFSAKDQQELDTIFKQASSQGLAFGENLENYLANIGQCLPVVASIAKVDKWNKQIIDERSENIGERAWGMISPWLGY